MSDRMTQEFFEVTPEVTRKVELLETLLFSFTEHVMNFHLLDVMEQEIYSIAKTQRTVN